MIPRAFSRPTASWVFAFAIAISGGWAALAQPTNTNQMILFKSMSLEELSNVHLDTVVGASKYEQATSDAPADVTIITAEDFKHYGWRTLGEALSSVRGLYVTSDRGYDHLGVDGINRPGDFGGRTFDHDRRPSHERSAFRYGRRRYGFHVGR